MRRFLIKVLANFIVYFLPHIFLSCTSVTYIRSFDRSDKRNETIYLDKKFTKVFICWSSFNFRYLFGLCMYLPKGLWFQFLLFTHCNRGENLVPFLKEIAN
jgi:hypothetical protein